MRPGADFRESIQRNPGHGLRKRESEPDSWPRKEAVPGLDEPLDAPCYARAMRGEHLEHGFAELSEVRLHYARSGEGELLLFLHGFPEYWYEWRVQLAHFSASHFAVAPDLRGYNLSSRPAAVSAYTPEHLARDIQELVHHFGRERCSVVAHDWG